MQSLIFRVHLPHFLKAPKLKIDSYEAYSFYWDDYIWFGAELSL